MGGSHFPGVLLFVNAPPNAEVASRLDPRGVLDAARLVQVERQAREQQVAGGACHGDGAPGRGHAAAALHLHAALPGRERGEQRHRAVGLPPRREVEAGIVGEVGFVQRQKQVRLIFHGERHTHGVLGRERRALVQALEILGAVAGYRPGGCVVSQAHLGELVHDLELAQRGLLGNLVAEAQPVVVHTHHHAQQPPIAALAQVEGQLVVVVAPGLHPLLIAAVAMAGGDLDICAQRAVGKAQAQPAGAHHLGAVNGERVAGVSVDNRDCSGKTPVGRGHHIGPESAQHRRRG